MKLKMEKLTNTKVVEIEIETPFYLLWEYEISDDGKYYHDSYLKVTEEKIHTVEKKITSVGIEYRYSIEENDMSHINLAEEYNSSHRISETEYLRMKSEAIVFMNQAY